MLELGLGLVLGVVASGGVVDDEEDWNEFRRSRVNMMRGSLVGGSTVGGRCERE